MRLLLLLVALFWYQSSDAAPSQTIVLGTADGVPLAMADGSGFHDQVLRQAFSRLGIRMEKVQLPAERALRNADQGIEEGVYVRVAGLEETYPNLVMVPESVSEYEFVVFAKKPDLQVQSWEDLQGYEVGIITGWKILENNIRNAKGLLKVKNPELLFRALVDDKVEVIVYNRLDGYGAIKELGLNGIHAIDPPLAVRPMYLYLHRSQAALTSQVAEALRAIKADGSYAAIREAVLAPYFPK